ncbi:putative membrane protein (TIGR01666 family) [Cricetibacter osteomyelitidis]|uniref:Putative membrane protein (TIGR01666 family) n=1 Tax=Cricetibacter osteomyelitidis TaxID=1521931 RepID=A0A4R2T047_9PAST|nr:YccS family putative transporter [Cricetibacter osteomyelitidis]TCP95215.1 putative membrane protein (TIGR01666 family) [Cricetibacter osteomyelitidis]
MKANWFNARILASVPIFLSVNIASVAVWFADISQQSMPLVLGIIAGALVDLDHRLTGRVKNLFYTLCAFSLTTVTVQLFITQNLWFVLMMTVLTFVLTMLGAVGSRYRTIAFGTLVVGLYTILTYLPETLWYLNPILILTGTLLYSLLSLLVYAFFPNRAVQENIADSFTALADYLDVKSSFFDPDDNEILPQKQYNLAMKNSLLTNAFNVGRLALFYRLKNQHRHIRTTKMIRYYFAAQEMHERANSSYFDYQSLTNLLKNTDLLFRIQRLFELQAQACRDIASGLRQNQSYTYHPRLERAIQGLNQSFEHYTAAHRDINASLLQHLRSLLDNLQGIDWQLSHLDQKAVENPDDNDNAQIQAENISGLHNIFYSIRSHFTFNSQLFRHAVRLSIVVFLCCAIVEIFQLERGYWILLTAIFVCQPNYSATKVRLKQRIIGTILGVIIGSLLPYFTATLEAKLGIVVLSSTLFYFFRTNNYSFSTFFITIQVLTSFDIMGFDIYAAMGSRVIDTFIGAVISWFGVSYLWPDWKYLALDKVAVQAIKSDAKYLLYIISQLQFGRGDDLKYRIVRRNAHEYATELSTTISNMNNEPEKYRTFLQDGFQLLNINYSLLSYISALGAFRNKMKQLHQSADFLAQFYPVAKKIIYVLENLGQLSQDEFEQLSLNIDLSLKQYASELNENHQGTDFTVPVQQLAMISQVLPQLNQAFCHIYQKSSAVNS